MSDQQLVIVQLSGDELRYLVACGLALTQHIPAQSLPTYCCMDKNQIAEFAARIRRLLDEHGLESIQQSFTVHLCAHELRYLVSCAFALFQNVSATTVPGCSEFDQKRVVEFSGRIAG